MQMQAKKNKNDQIYWHKFIESESDSGLESDRELKSKTELESDTVEKWVDILLTSNKSKT